MNVFNDANVAVSRRLTRKTRTFRLTGVHKSNSSLLGLFQCSKPLLEVACYFFLPTQLELLLTPVRTVVVNNSRPL